jgi:TonB family protein
VAAPVPSDDRGSRWGYLAAIVVSALGHAALFVLLLIVLPGLFRSAGPPPAYTVKIVDAIPAGDLGTHLPRLSQDRRNERRNLEAEHHEPPKPAPTPPPPDNDKNAIALNTLHATPTPTPPPPPAPTPTPSVPLATPTPRPRHKHPATPVPTPTPAPPKRSEHHKPKVEPAPQLAKVQPQHPKAKPTPDVKQELAKVREKLLAEHLKQEKARSEAALEKNATKPNEGGGPVLASKETTGEGMGVGPGNGSAGIQQDPEFLLYYQEVQKKIKAAWSFAGDNPDLTASVTFGINPDGSLNSVKVIDSSRDPAFDDSVVRAIRRAAPFAAPPDKYRDQFATGVEAVFKLGELSS